MPAPDGVWAVLERLLREAAVQRYRAEALLRDNAELGYQLACAREALEQTGQKVTATEAASLWRGRR